MERRRGRGEERRGEGEKKSNLGNWEDEEERMRRRGREEGMSDEE